jgi:hypothetical protein
MNTFKKQTIIACTPVKAQTSALINHNRSGSNPSVKSQSSDVIARSCSIQRPASAPNIDIHDSYMVRTHRSEKKLNNFFGDNDVPFDITISEIEASGLKAMLQSKVPLCYFLSSLLEDYCSENLFFFLEALEFERTVYESKQEQQESAVYIYNTYLSRKSCLEINIDEKIHNDVHNFIKNMNSNTSSESVSKCFKSARNSVYQLMEGSFAKFIKSNHFQTMKKELGHRIYNNNDKMNAVCKLRDYIMKYDANNKQSLEENPSNQLAISNAKHHEVITILVHEFTKSILDINFNEKDIYLIHKTEIRY